jgi:hypothetical protein
VSADLLLHCVRRAFGVRWLPVSARRDHLGGALVSAIGLACRGVEELLPKRGINVDHVNIFRWVQRCAPLFAGAARPGRHRVDDRWWIDETYIKVSGQWRYVYRAIDQFGQVTDVYVSIWRLVPGPGVYGRQVGGPVTVSDQYPSNTAPSVWIRRRGRLVVGLSSAAH